MEKSKFHILQTSSTIKMFLKNQKDQKHITPGPNFFYKKYQSYNTLGSLE